MPHCPTYLTAKLWGDMLFSSQGFPGAANAGGIRDACSIPGLGRSPGEGHGNPLQLACLDNPMDRGAWQATAHRVAQSQTRLKWFSTQHMCLSVQTASCPGTLHGLTLVLPETLGTHLCKPLLLFFVLLLHVQLFWLIGDDTLCLLTPLPLFNPAELSSLHHQW